MEIFFFSLLWKNGRECISYCGLCMLFSVSDLKWISFRSFLTSLKVTKNCSIVTIGRICCCYWVWCKDNNGNVIYRTWQMCTIAGMFNTFLCIAEKYRRNEKIFFSKSGVVRAKINEKSNHLEFCRHSKWFWAIDAFGELRRIMERLREYTITMCFIDLDIIFAFALSPFIIHKKV